MDKTNRNYILLILALLLLLGMSTITLTFLIDSNRSVNIFHIGENVSAVSENFSPPEKIRAGDKVEKRVAVKNDRMRSFVRMYIAVSDSEGGEKFTMNLNTADWKQEEDGYYYYQKPVPYGGETTPIFDTLTFREDLPEKENLQILCYAESVQAEGYRTAKEAFYAIKG